MDEVLKKRYQVFVSSTYEDLVDERKHTMQALLETKCIPAGMELFPAASDDQWTLIKRVIDDCDYYIVIVAGKYGSCGKDGKSYTEMEFDYALASGIPVVGFFHDNLDALPGSKLEKSDERRAKQQAFIGKVKSRMCRSWRTPDGLASAVKSAMLHEIENHPRPGWVRHSPSLRSSNQKTKHALFADSETHLQVQVKIKYPKWDDKEKTQWNWCSETQVVALTLGEIFSVIAPRLMEKRSRVGLKKMVNHWIEKTHLQERISKLVEMDYPHLSVDVDLNTFNQVLDTLVANKLLKRVPPPPHVRTYDFYWQLTSSGIQRLAEQKAMRPMGNEVVHCD